MPTLPEALAPVEPTMRLLQLELVNLSLDISNLNLVLLQLLLMLLQVLNLLGLAA
jgi:hypothetical protein